MKNYKQTVKEIIRLSDSYWEDLLESNKYGFDFKNCDFPKFFYFIKSLPYVSDPKGIEHVSRPKISLENSGIKSIYPFDCDDRAVLTRSFCLLKNYQNCKNPYGIIKPKVIVAGKNIRPHHVYISIDIPNILKDFPIDPTYPKNQYGKTLFKELFREVYE
ncbi:MAG: hypothetical protein KDK54_19695 [Leptospiraceae bacterium]|nr:hypothetical protein [Leptospiraceae bacterium]